VNRPSSAEVEGGFAMLFNRISAYLEDVASPSVSEPGPTPINTVTTPPANFAPVPAGLMSPLPAQPAFWQEQLYRMAYEAAKAAVEAAARAASRARWN
jgi:NAD(P)-dependent dehydrogenase (short-subunit alcohol dehydrogenase family)